MESSSPYRVKYLQYFFMVKCHESLNFALLPFFVVEKKNSCIFIYVAHMIYCIFVSLAAAKGPNLNYILNKLFTRLINSILSNSTITTINRICTVIRSIKAN